MQQINLYQAQFKPKQVILPPSQLLLIILLVITILAVISLYASKENSVLHALIEKQQQQTMQQIDVVTDTPLLDAELKKLQQQNQDKDSLLTYLTSHDFGNQLGFSESLKNLSQQRINNVWLTAFSFSDGGQAIKLEGKALQSSQIPLYIDNLARAKHFQGKQFSVFQLQQPKDDAGLYIFKLHTNTGDNE